jgi:hypothetical protein
MHMDRLALKPLIDQVAGDAFNVQFAEHGSAPVDDRR